MQVNPTFSLGVTDDGLAAWIDSSLHTLRQESENN